MKIMGPMRLLPIILVSAIMAVSCSGVQDAAEVNPTPQIKSIEGEYSFSEVIDSIQTAAPTETTPAQFFYLKREYTLQLVDKSKSSANEAHLFITEWASPDRVFITHFKGSFTFEGQSVRLVLNNMTVCDGVDIIVDGQVNTASSQLKLAFQHCPPVYKNIELVSDSPISTLTANSTTHN